jgi:hypothetical protein
MQKSLAAAEHGEPIPRLKVPKTDESGAPIDPAIRQEIKEYLTQLRADLRERLVDAKPSQHGRITERFFSDRAWPLEQWTEFNAELRNNQRGGPIPQGFHEINLHGIKPVEVYTTVGPGTRFEEVRRAVIDLLDSSSSETPQVTIKADAHTASLVRHYVVEPLRADPDTARLVEWMHVRYDESVPRQK